MTDAVQVFDTGFRVLDANGTPLSGAKIKFYEAGTTTPKAVFSDATLSTSLGSVVYTRSDGFPVASSGSNTTVLVYTGSDDYKIEITDASDVAVFPSKDNVKGAVNTSEFLTASDTSILDLPVLHVSATTYALTAARNGKVIVGNTAGGSVSMTLDSASTLGDGWTSEIRKSSSSNTLSITTTGGEFINETSTSFTLTDKNDFVQLRCDGTQFFATAYRIPVTRDGPTGFISGYTMSNNATDATNDIDITAGRARSDDDTVDISVTSAFTKRTDAVWAAGTGNGMLDTGSVTNATYHIFAIYNPTSGATDYLSSTSASAPTMPSGYTKKRRIGSIVRSSGAIKGFIQYGDRFLWKAAVTESLSADFTSSQANHALTIPAGIDGLVADIFVAGLVTGSGYGIVTGHPSVTLAAPTATSNFPTAPHSAFNGASAGVASSRHFCHANASRQIAVRASSASDVNKSTIMTFGWIDNRGKDG